MLLMCCTTMKLSYKNIFSNSKEYFVQDIKVLMNQNVSKLKLLSQGDCHLGHIYSILDFSKVYDTISHSILLDKMCDGCATGSHVGRRLMVNRVSLSLKLQEKKCVRELRHYKMFWSGCAIEIISHSLDCAQKIIPSPTAFT